MFQYYHVNNINKIIFLLKFIYQVLKSISRALHELFDSICLKRTKKFNSLRRGSYKVQDFQFQLELQIICFKIYKFFTKTKKLNMYFAQFFHLKLTFSSFLLLFRRVQLDHQEFLEPILILIIFCNFLLLLDSFLLFFLLSNSLKIINSIL